ncbi:hypothetical protein [Pedobacter nototheniae]|uniref:hypothetical protein n=1 Tax=Pedobacter nototheniae TaxID=2488994 RepID=UPI00103AAA2E|nr:hypothetical protein [Pedobacter nototheniae]
MKNIYNLIWVDSILRFKKHNPKNKNWKIMVFIINTWMNALNWWIIFMVIKYFKLFHIPLIELNIFPGHLIDDFINFVIEFALPFGVFNYFLIFYRNRYERLIMKYGPQRIKYALIYSMVSTGGAFVFAIVYGILTHTI